MEQLRFIVISVTLLLCTANAFAQRHYENISALEINYGTNIFGDADNYTSLSFSKYINQKSYWKTGVGYFEKSDEYSLPKNESPVIPESGTPIGKDTIKAWILSRWRLLQNAGKQSEIHLLECRHRRLHRCRISASSPKGIYLYHRAQAGNRTGNIHTTPNGHACPHTTALESPVYR